MGCGVFGYAVTCLRRSVNYQLIGCFGLQRARLYGWLRDWRIRCGHCRSRQLFVELHQSPADEKTVDEESGPDHGRDYSQQPQIADDLRGVRISLPRHGAEEEIEGDHHADADQTGNDSALNLIEPFLLLVEAFLFRSNAAPPLQFF